MSEPTTTATTLRWRDGDKLPDDLHAFLLGPGGVFEMADDEVLGERLPVFVNRPRTLVDALRRTATATPHRPYLLGPDHQLTFAEMLDRAAAVAHGLATTYGVGPGDRVAILSANCVDYGLALWATVWLGGIVAGFNGWWTTPEIADALDLVAPTVVLGDAKRLERMPDTEVPTVTFGGPEWAHLLAASAVAPADAVEDDPAIILFTSGTTGRPKGAVLTHRNLVHFAQSSAVTTAVNGILAGTAEPPPPEPPPTILASPLFHISGLATLLVAGASFGTTILVPRPGRWDEIEHLELTQRHGVAQWSMVPTQVWRLLECPTLHEYDLSSLRSIGGGGAVWPPEIIKAIREAFPGVGVTFRAGYGMTECTGLATMLQFPYVDRYPSSVGEATAGVEVEVRDDSGHPVPDGEVGEICIRSGGVFLRYWGNDEASAAAFHPGRWYRSGDFGRIVDGVVLQLESRMRDLIIRGGENIYPIEIENRLLEHPGIADAAVIGVDHPVLGQEVKAVVVARLEAGLTDEAVRAWVAAGLARYKVPAVVEFRDELPYSPTGKLLKSELEG